MTTICYRDGQMAADTLTCFNSTILGYTDKIERLPDGSLIGACGTGALCRAVIEWFKAGRPKDDKPVIVPNCNFTALVVSPDGSMALWHEDFQPGPFRAEFVSIGSGADFADGAMAMGASAEQAVRIAMTRDTATGGDVTVLTLDKPNRKKETRDVRIEEGDDHRHPGLRRPGLSRASCAGGMRVRRRLPRASTATTEPMPPSLP